MFHHIEDDAMFHHIEDDERFLDSVILIDESTFHVSGKISPHNCSKNPPISLEHVLDSPKVNVFSALVNARVYCPFFFMETTITDIVYLDMPQQFLIPVRRR
jgi:hypothetical protein